MSYKYPRNSLIDEFTTLFLSLEREKFIFFFHSPRASHSLAIGLLLQAAAGAGARGVGAYVEQCKNKYEKCAATEPLRKRERERVCRPSGALAESEIEIDNEYTTTMCVCPRKSGRERERCVC